MKYYKTIYCFNNVCFNVITVSKNTNEAQIESTKKLKERRPHDWFMFCWILTDEISEEDAFR